MGLYFGFEQQAKTALPPVIASGSCCLLIQTIFLLPCWLYGYIQLHEAISLTWLDVACCPVALGTIKPQAGDCRVPSGWRTGVASGSSYQ